MAVVEVTTDNLSSRFSFGDEYLSSSELWKSCGTYINIANGDTATHFEYVKWFSWGGLEEEKRR